MSNIPTIKTPYEDELLYSWIFRLANANGLSISTFSDAYLGTDNAKISSLPYDVRNEFVNLYHNIYNLKDIGNLYKSLSLFGFESLFMTEETQTRYINNVFRNKDALNPSVESLLDTVKICPKCIKEDTDAVGEPYLHRAHQYSGVCMCHKHNVPLFEYTGIKGHACEYNISDFTEINRITDTDYAVYVKRLADANINGNISDIKTLTNTDSNNPILLVKKLMEIYPDISDIYEELKDNVPIIEEYVCDDCGTDYIVTPQGYKNGWKCPKCELKQSLQERFKQLVKTSENGRYEAVGAFQSMDIKVKIKHSVCGEISEIKPRSFLFEGLRCKCEYIISEAEARKNIESNQGFKLIKFTKSEEPITVFHEKCGREFICNYQKFIKFPGCRLCHPKNMDTEHLAKQINERTNGEYELIGEFIDQNTKVKILHKACGNITEYSPRYFYMGAVCPYCSNKYAIQWEEMFQLYLNYQSETGNKDVPKREIYKGKNLGTWCNHQRQDFKDKSITDYHFNKLKNADFIFDPLEDEWNRRYEQYKRYIAETGSCTITRRTDFEGEHLGAWIDTQRKWYKAGKMSEERIKKLFSINNKIFLSN